MPLKGFIRHVCFQTSLRSVYNNVIGTFSTHKNVKRNVAFATVALQCQISAGVAFLEDFVVVRKVMTLVFQLSD